MTIEQTKIDEVVLEVKTVRFDAKQPFVRQEMPFVQIIDPDGLTGLGYIYIIGTGPVISLLADNLAPKLRGLDPELVEKISRKRRRSVR